jgi:ribA/ribD-fused uncharacterized protein
MTAIRFFKVPDPWGYFSNFSRHPFLLDGKTWPSTEHYFQAQKFVITDPEWAHAIWSAPTPAISATMGRDRAHPMRADWDQVKYYVMLLALWAKFTQHRDCDALLMATGWRDIIEDTGKGPDDDHIWGDGSTGTGQNLLGKALMELRQSIYDHGIESVELALMCRKIKNTL